MRVKNKLFANNLFAKKVDQKCSMLYIPFLMKLFRKKFLNQKCIMLLVILFFITPCASGYDSEGGLEESESFSVEYQEGYDYYEWKTPERPNWYDPVVKLVVKIMSFFITDETITVTHEVEKEEWDGSNYQPSGDKSTFSWDIHHDKNTTETTITTVDPVEEYFKDDLTRLDDFTSLDDDREHPDVLNVTTTIDLAGTKLDSEEHGYTTLTEDNLNEIKQGVSGRGYGFDINSVCGEGGSGSLSNTIGWGEMDETSKEHKCIFDVFFFSLIPIIFVLLIFNIMSKVL